MNTEFLSGVMVARMLEGMKFALGPTATARRQVLADIGGWDRLKDYLAEDFVLGNFAAEKGWRRHPVVLCDRASHRLSAVRRECATPTAMVSQHPTIAAGRVCRPAVYESAAARDSPVSLRARLVAGADRHDCRPRLRRASQRPAGSCMIR